MSSEALEGAQRAGPGSPRTGEGGVEAGLEGAEPGWEKGRTWLFKPRKGAGARVSEDL